jgi:hypothetical protein
VVAFEYMPTTLACLYHWYTSALFVVPVLVVGGWCWWSSKRLSNDDQDDPPGGGSLGELGDGPAY